VKISKTLSLRIIRPYYTPEVESAIKAEKDKREAQGQTRNLDAKFFNELKKKHPQIILSGEFYSLLFEMQRQLTSIYNRAMSSLYHKIIVEGEKTSTSKALSDIGYDECKSVFPSYIALGLRQKIQSNFRRKELKGFRMAVPTAKSDKFPIPIYKQVDDGKGGFKISENKEGDFIVELPLVEYTAEDVKTAKGKFTKINISKPPKIKNIPVILSTLRRKQSGQWFSDEGTNAEIRRVISGEYKVSWIEVVRRTRFGKHDDWFLNIVIKYDKTEDGLDPEVVGGIDVGVSTPLVCAVNNSLDRYFVKSSDIIAFKKRAMARRRTLLRQNRFKRSGHGSKSKLEPITILTEKNERFKKSIMQRWAKEVAEFFKGERASVVQMEELSGLKEKDNFFGSYLRMYWNYGQLQQIIENKLKEYGIKVNYVSPKDTSKKCHSCGYINEFFTFEFRQKNNFPLFKCKKCGVECNADYNAAKNIAIA